MKLHIPKVVALLLALICAVSVAPTVLAAQPENKLDNIQVTVQVVHQPRIAEIYKILLTPDQEGTPMPDGARDGVFMMTIKGAGAETFPAIAYPKVGVYHYTIKQRPGSNRRASYDQTVYHLTVYVTREETDVKVTPVLTKEGRDEKPDAIVFTNTYPSYSVNTPKTNDESNFPLYFGMAAASILVLVLLFLTRRREGTEE